jgi:hypothetical protein
MGRRDIVSDSSASPRERWKNAVRLSIWTKILLAICSTVLFQSESRAQTQALPAGVYPVTLQQDGLRSGLLWLGSLHQLLLDHASATGQTIRFEVTHEPSVSPEAALVRAREGLLALPLDLGQRQVACFIAGFYGENKAEMFDISSIEIECGLGLTSIPVTPDIRRLTESIVGKTVSRKAWEATLLWIGLEVLRACESPILNTATLPPDRIEKFPDSLQPILKRWLASQVDHSRHPVNPAEFKIEPADYGERAPLFRWVTGASEIFFLLIMAITSVGLLILMRILRSPITFISGSGARNLIGTEKLKLYWANSNWAERRRFIRNNRDTFTGPAQVTFEVLDD